jgi:2'-5' RNA ligase
MRLFVAIDLDDEVRAAIAEEQKRLRRILADGQPRWVPPEQLHLTLVFIGETDDALLAAIVDAMGRDIPQSPFRLTFGDLGVFPPDGAPRVLWMGVVEGARAVVDLQHEIVRRLECTGVVFDRRLFQPHLTLARWRYGRRSDRSRVAGAPASIVPAVRVEAVTLYHSRVSSSGAAHSALVSGRLRGNV